MASPHCGVSALWRGPARDPSSDRGGHQSARTWSRIEAGTSGTRTIAGRKLFIYAQGGKINNVAWHTPTGAYWISNTLTEDLTNNQMVSIAASLTQ